MVKRRARVGGLWGSGTEAARVVQVRIQAEETGTPEA